MMMVSPSVPPSALRVLLAAAVAGFAGLLVFAARAEADAAAFLPLVFIAALWLAPLGAAAWRGDRRLFVLALALLVFISEANFRSRPWTDKSLDWQLALKGGVWLGAGLLGALHLGGVGRALLRPPALFAGLLVGLMVLSTVWSADPGFTLDTSLGYVCFLLFALAACQRLEEDDILLGMALGLAAIVVPSLLVAPFGSSLAGFSPGSTAVREHRLAGVTDHPVGLAQNAALALFACGLALARGIGRRWIWSGVILCALAALALSRSRMPVLAVGLAWAGAMLAHRRLLPQGLAVLAGLGLVVGLGAAGWGLDAVIPDGLLTLVSRSGQASEVLTLTGRAEVWAAVLHKVEQAPWLGHGFGTGMILLRDFHRWHLVHAHNGYLQTLLYTGLIGLALLLAAMAWQFWVFLTAPRLLRDTLFLMVLLMGITEQTPVPNTPGGASLWWLLAVGLCVAPRLSPLPSPPSSPSP